VRRTLICDYCQCVSSGDYLLELKIADLRYALQLFPKLFVLFGEILSGTSTGKNGKRNSPISQCTLDHWCVNGVCTAKS
jgi:hypothetical protein